MQASMKLTSMMRRRTASATRAASGWGCWHAVCGDCAVSTPARLAQYAQADVNREPSTEIQGQLLIDLSPFSSADPDRFVADRAAAVRPSSDWAA